MQVTSEPALAPLLSELIHSMEGVEVNLRWGWDLHGSVARSLLRAQVAQGCCSSDCNLALPLGVGFALKRYAHVQIGFDTPLLQSRLHLQFHGLTMHCN